MLGDGVLGAPPGGLNNNYSSLDMESLEDMLLKLSELEQRVLEAEGRAEEAEDKVRVMEQRLCSWNNAESTSQSLQHQQRSNGQHQQYQQLTSVQQQLSPSHQHQQQQQQSPAHQQQLTELRVGDCRAIESLETQVNEQKQLRLQDARQVEAKAARIKEWVTNKLRELEQQNQLLRDQNARCCHQLTLLRNHIATQGSRYSTVPARTSLSLDGAGLADCSPGGSPGSTRSASRGLSQRRRSESLEPGALCSGRPAPERHRRNCSTGGGARLADMSCGDALAQDLAEAVDSLTLHNRPLLPPRQASPAAVAGNRADSADLMHDYAEIYTPSREDKLPIWLCSSGAPDDALLPPAPGPSNGSSSTNSESLSEYVGGAKPPTPPLHRFPSWEAKIYQVAADGLKQWVGSVEGEGHGVNLSSGYCDISVPVYATVKGRASQIRSMPFTGDSSDDSSDGEEAGQQHATPNHGPAHTTTTSHQSSDSSVSGSSPSKSAKTSASLSPAKRSSSGSPGKSKARGVSDTSFESGLSDDYAIPPDALSCDATSTDASMPSLLARASYADSPRRAESLEKIGHLTKLGGKLKTWRKRWFVLKNGALVYWKSQNDVNRKPQGQIALDESCRITRQDGASTFEINTGKKIYYLTADSIATMEEWVRVLQNVQRRNAARLLLSKEDQKPTVQGWLTKVKNGHAKKCWCSLMGKMFLYFKLPSDTTPLGQINMRDARVEEVEHVSDSDSEEREETGASQARLTVSIYPEHQGPTYLILPSKQERDNWLYHLTIVSGGGPNAGTQYEQLVQKLMETDGNPACDIWRHPQLLHSKDNIVSPLTTLLSESLQAEAIKLFKCCQLFMSAAVEQAGIDYHVVLAQNALQVCLDSPELQSELVCALVKQTSRHMSHQGSTGVQVKPGKTLLSKPARQLLLCATQTLFTCDTHSYSSSAQNAQNAQAANSSPTSSIQAPQLPPPADCKSNPPTYSFVQGWQLLALAVSLFVPRNSRLLWYLKLHLSRNAETKTECGKYAAYCERALERTIQNGGRDVKPSRMEVLSILLKNPYHHSLPHAIPVHMLNGAYQVVGFDGSTTIEEFLHTLNQEIACRDSAASGFTLFSDDPIEKDLEHFIDPQAKLCDVISKWETALREKGSGKFENSRVIQLTYKNRLYWRHAARMETDRERLLLCYQVNQQVVLGRFPLSRELALEMASLMAQIDLGEQTGERLRGSGGTSATAVLHALDKFYPYRYRDTLTPEALRDLQDLLAAKWAGLKGRSVLDCVRIYLTCARKWPFFGASMFQARPKFSDQAMAWLAVSEDSVTVLELASMAVVSKFSYSSVITFGGCQDDFMLVVGSEDGCGTEQKMLFAMSKPKVLEITLLIADYMNALGHTVPGTPQMNTLTRNGSRRSFRPLVVASTCNNTLSSHGQPDILKSTPDHQRIGTEPKRRAHTDSSLA